MKRRRGFTLIELMTAFAISLLVVGLVAQLLLPSLWLFQKEQTVSEVHQGALVVMNRLQRELQNTCLETVTLVHRGSDRFLAWAEVESYSPVSHGPNYDSRGCFRVLCYLAQPRLVRIGRATHPDVAPAQFSAASALAPRLTDAQLTQIVDGAAGTDWIEPLKTLARNVELLDITDEDSGDFAVFYPPLKIQVTTRAAVAVASGQEPRYQTVELVSKVTPRVKRW